MKAYVGQVNSAGLQRFLPEAAVPGDSLREFVRACCSRSTTVVWAVIPQDGADTVRRELAAGRHHAACSLLLNQAAELLPIGAAAPELTRSVSLTGCV